MKSFLILSLAAALACCGAPPVAISASPAPGASGARPSTPAVAQDPAASGHAVTDAAAEPLTADEAVRLALARSPELRAAEAQRAASEAAADAAGALPDLTARVAVESLPYDSPRAGEEILVGVSQALPLGGERAAEREAADAGVRAAAARARAEAVRVELHVRAAHAAALAEEEVIRLLHAREALAETRCAGIAARVTAGEDAAAALDPERVALGTIEHELEEAQHARAAQGRALAAAIGSEHAARPLAGDLAGAFDLPGLAELGDDLARLPEIQESEAEAALAAARARVAEGRRWPALLLDLGWRERADGRDAADFGVGLAIPWSGPSTARARAARLEAAAGRARADRSTRDLRLAIADGHDALARALHLLEIHDEVLVPAAERGAARAAARRAAGDASLLEATAAEDALLEARLARLGVWTEVMGAWARLEPFLRP